MTTTPDWFIRAVERPAQSHFVDVSGAQIHYLTWNAHDTDKPGLLLAHGFRAHARWWSFIAPYLTDRFRVAALDFAGMGDSGHRATYSAEQYGEDLIGVMDACRFERATLIGHSFGGSRVVRACADHPHRIDRAVVIDSFIPLPGLPRPGGRPMPPRAKKVYPSYEAARARFRLVPEENCTAPYVLDYVAQHSLRQVEGGWTWKFDENYTPMRDEPAAEAAHAESVLQRVSVPVSIIYGELSIVMTKELAAGVVQRLQHGRGPIEVPESHHHVLLDQPLALVAALRAALAQ